MFLGRHTCLPWVFEERRWASVPLLASIGGAPPYLLLVGDRRRAARALALLDEGCDLAALASEKGGPHAAGRVAVVLGRTAGVPVLVVETQMGGPATEIITREVLSEAFHPEGARAAIRVGSCGVRSNLDPTPTLALASFSTGWSAAIEQSSHGVLEWHGQFGDPPVLPCTPSVLRALQEGAREADVKAAQAIGGVFSKDSLYAEQEHDFGGVLERLGCIATEMELATIGPIAEAKGVPWGGVMAAAGYVAHGGWFAREQAEANEALALRAALAAVRRLGSPAA